MGLKARYVRNTVFIRNGLISFHIPGGQAHHAAKNRHGGCEIGAVAFLGIQQEIGHEVNGAVLRGYLQGIAEVAGQIVLQGKCLFIGGLSLLGDALGQVIERLLQMIRQLQIGLQYRGVVVVRCGGVRVDDGTQARVPGHKQRG